MLVSKVIEVSDTPVEILAGEDTSQAYALYLTPDVSGAWIGGPDVVADTGSGATVSGLSGPTYPMLIQGESLWVVTGGSTVFVRALAVSIPG